jgi:poly(3-hydroxybutyrate) depolymerase
LIGSGRVVWRQLVLSRWGWRAALSSALYTEGSMGMARVGVLEAHKFERTITTTVGAAYLLYLPEGYGAEPDRRWPLILFLHGRGESGSNLDRVKRHGLARRLDEGLELPAIVVSPQCPAGGWWTTDVLSARPLKSAPRDPAREPVAVPITR